MIEGWRWRLPVGMSTTEFARAAEEVAAESQYGWGQTVEFDEARVEGFLGTKWRNVIAEMDRRGWLPSDLAGRDVVDIGCFSGAQTLVLAGRGAATVVAVDEVPEHLDQCRFLARTVGADTVEHVEASVYELPRELGSEVADLALMSGVLYHLSDMLVGLVATQELLRPGGELLLQTNAVECHEHSYANFGRFYAGWWWQPTALCIRDLCDYAGYTSTEIHFYEPGRCIVRAEKSVGAPTGGRVPFKRGLNWEFPDLTDAEARHLDARALAPAPDTHATGRLLARWSSRVAERLLRTPLSVAAWLRNRARWRRN